MRRVETRRPKDGAARIGAFAFWTYSKAGHVDLKLAMLTAVGFTIGGWLGGVWFQHLSAIALRRGFAVLLILLVTRRIKVTIGYKRDKYLREPAILLAMRSTLRTDTCLSAGFAHQRPAPASHRQ